MKTLLLHLFFLPFISISQHEYLVYLKDKDGSKLVEFEERAIKRRALNDVQIDANDLDVSDDYLNELAKVAIIKGKSRWMNSVYLQSKLSSEELKAKFDFIRSVSEINYTSPTKIRKDDLNVIESKSVNYGVADTQIRQIGIDCMHNDGFYGEGIYLAVIDAGFKGMDTIHYFDSTFINGRVLDQFDFVNGAGVFDYSNHGTAVSSCIFSFKQDGGQDDFSGGAPRVDVALYVSEDVFTESIAEEFNLVQALERCDTKGVQIANISLGYTNFDNSAENHPYSDLDGNTTIAAKGVNTAVSKGIIVVAAAGNEGPNTISTPCDADSCLCVAAVDNQGNYAFFSSVGPSSDGQVKPDVAATGWNTWIVDDFGNLVQGSGTSFASPMMCGGVACLIQAHPTMQAYDIIEAVRASGSQFNNPDQYLGYGIADMCTAHQDLTNQSAGIQTLEEKYHVYPNPAQNTLSIKGLNESITVSIVDALGRQVWKENVSVEGTIDVSSLSSGYYQLIINTSKVSFVKR